MIISTSSTTIMINLKDCKCTFKRTKEYHAIIEIQDKSNKQKYIGYVKNIVNNDFINIADFDIYEYIKKAFAKKENTKITYYTSDDCSGKYIHVQFQNLNICYDGDFYNIYYTIVFSEKKKKDDDNCDEDTYDTYVYCEKNNAIEYF